MWLHVGVYGLHKRVCCIWESNLHQRHAGLMLYQLSYIMSWHTLRVALWQSINRHRTGQVSCHARWQPLLFWELEFWKLVLVTDNVVLFFYHIQGFCGEVQTIISHMFFLKCFFEDQFAHTRLTISQDHNGSMNWDNCGQISLTSCFWAFFFLIDSHTVPGQHSRPTLTSQGQECKHV